MSTAITVRTSGAIALTLFLSSFGYLRADEVQFVGSPSVTRSGGKTAVSFSMKKPTNVEVSILDAKGKVVRHLAAGVLGGKNPPPAPLKVGLSQEIEWDESRPLPHSG